MRTLTIAERGAPMDETEEIQPINAEERKLLLSQMGKLAAAARKQYRTVCLECGKDLIGLTRKRFCSQAHQRRNWRRRLAMMNPGDTLPPPEAGTP